MTNRKFLFIVFSCFVIFASCSKSQDLDLTEIDQLSQDNTDSLIQKTQTKPWTGGQYVDGKRGGTWNDSIINDPKTFNQLIGERDGQSSAIISYTLDYLVDYDPTLRKWQPRIASYKIETNEENNTLIVHYEIRSDAYWSYFNKEEKIPVTSDDFVFWYNEIAGDPELGSSDYGQQWVTLENGEAAHIDCVKIDDKHFDFIFPRIVAEPLLATNMSLCPSFIFKPAKEKGGIDGVKDLFSIDTDPKEIPSCGMWYITEYVPAQRLVFERNPNYWQKDKNGVSIPYYDKLICQIIGDQNTDYLLFTQGKTESYSPRPEEYDDLINNQKEDYTVFNAEGSMGASMWSFNQNPVNKDQPYYKWFTKKEFRQAMSCIFNRDRVASQTYRGFAQAKYDFFPEANPFYNPDISLKYRFDPDQAQELLKKAGFTKKEGFYYDQDGNKLEFDLTIASSNSVLNDLGQIVVDEAAKIGVTINIRQIDFQKIVEMLTATYDWQSVFIGLGANLFPSQGSNVWPSQGNLHMWYPCQESPATEWEARVDYLYNEGCYTNDYDKAKVYWDEYQQILLEECPVIYLMRSRSFFAIRNKWNLSNVYYDNKNGAMLEHVYIN
ncbi:MAG: ABC transporter substrate-binding protein [Treponema sp.]|nr:ABC transporter substrate-binding protein [Treponema sp.]